MIDVIIQVAVDDETFTKQLSCRDADDAAEKVMKFKQVEGFDSWSCPGTYWTAIDRKLARLEWEAFEADTYVHFTRGGVRTILGLFERGDDDLRDAIREWLSPRAN